MAEQTYAYGRGLGGTGGGGGGLHFRKPDDEFKAANLAACRVLRDAYFGAAANAAALREFQGDQSLAIILNPANSTDNTFETYLGTGTAYDSTRWLSSTDAIAGNTGPVGPLPSGSQIKTRYERNADTNAYTDGEKSKLSGIASGAEVNRSQLSGQALLDAIDTALGNVTSWRTGSTARTAAQVVALLDAYLLGSGWRTGGGGGGAVSLGSVTLSARRLTAAAPSGYSRYPDGTLLLFKVESRPDPSWTGSLSFYIGTDSYDLYESGTGSVTHNKFTLDTTYLAVVSITASAIQLIGPLADAALLSGATFRGAARGIAPVRDEDFVTKAYADANYSGGAPPPTPAVHDLYAGWSADVVITDAEIVAGGNSNSDRVLLPTEVGSQYMFVWREDADGGDPSEVFIAGAGNSRPLFGVGVARTINAVSGVLIVSVNTFNAVLTGGEIVRVV